MRILYICNYAAWEKIKNKQLPSHHMFGINELIAYYDLENGKTRGYLKKGGYVDFYLTGAYDSRFHALNQVRQSLFLLLKSFKYDVYIDTLNQCTKVLGIFRRLGLMRTRLVSFLHHPPFNIELQLGRSDAYIFFNDVYKKYATHISPRYIDRFYTVEWCPDKEWYHNDVINMEKTTVNRYLLDNGRTQRDRNLLIRVAERCKEKCVLCGERQTSIGYIDTYKLDLTDDYKQIKILKGAKAIIIAINKDYEKGLIYRLINHINENKYLYRMFNNSVINIKSEEKLCLGPVGNTSFMDAIAMQLPIICSSNTCFAKTVEEKKLGVTFPPGDEEALVQSIKKLNENYNLYKKAMIEFSSTMDIKKYSNEIEKIIRKVCEI